MKDSTREEVIQWCIENKIDFCKPVFPPPEGWGWADNKGVEVKSLVSICPHDEEDIDSFDVVFKLAAQG